ncbi:MAG: PilZ domain-containing protein [Proteobacteria bacterium]|nr:PilZ domain-containing protein [Pseudomonadota bacterium]MBU1596761.1 PilZ domain-containing protein [Pseudomonadota bacterium]
MGAGSARRDVLVLTDRPQDYEKEMERLRLAAQYAPSVTYLLDRLHDHPFGGFVLEVEKVMRAPRLERSQIFQLAGVFPVLRVLRQGQGGEVAYLDDPEGFPLRVQGFAPREVRHSGRVPVVLDGLLAASDDFYFTNAARASILDISDGGGFVSSPCAFGSGELVRLRIEGLEDRTPILSNICWRKAKARASGRNGFGLRFLDIRPGQLKELAARHLAPRGLLAEACASS